MAKIYILTGPIQTGKTTALMQWSNGQENIGGFLTPDVHNIRQLYDISADSYHPYEAIEATNPVLKIGKFMLFSEAFETMQTIVNRDVKNGCDYLIIDELGRMEINGKGSAALITKTINVVRSSQTIKGLIIIVRKDIIASAIEIFGLADADIISTTNLNIKGSIS